MARLANMSKLPLFYAFPILKHTHNALKHDYGNLSPTTVIEYQEVVEILK